jgi:beta-carotene 3-hydroxylase
MLLWATVFLASLIGTEGLAHVMHRHVMHGPGWLLHRSHHRPRHGRLEWNDVFHLIFAVPSIGLIYVGWWFEPWLLPIGTGMAVYGVANWAFHDVLVHRRLPHFWLPRGGYLRRLVQAHHIHHATRERLGAESFGFFYAPDYSKRPRRRSVEARF